ncbi:MAG TPA: alpha/beta hydrolase [Verrucomicrobiae bacterium]|jgi:pimeloyl-ACP methyl ester carboxylesterase|nr:alpha/beta hydrolase [Verrucomicrobiae bacterium]
MATNDISIPLPQVKLGGDLNLPAGASNLVIFAHGSGSSRCSPRNRFVARALRERAKIGTFLFDLLTAEEEETEAYTRHLRFNIPLLAERLVAVTRWVLDTVKTRDINVGYFGSSTGAAAALVAAAELRDTVGVVVSRGGRPDLAGDALGHVRASTLLIVGGNDKPVIPLNEEAYYLLHCERALRIVPGASHLFEEEGTLEKVAEMAADWFASHFHPMTQHA